MVFKQSSEENGGVMIVKPQTEYRIFACKYGGPMTKKVAMSLWNFDWDTNGPINYYVWAIKAPDGEIIVVDTGCSPDQAEMRKLNGYVNPVEVLARLGANANSVTKVVISHMHWDHVGNIENYLSAFPYAKFYVQKRELDFCESPLSTRKPIALLFDSLANKKVSELAGCDKLVIVDGDFRLTQGVDLFLASGHTLGLQVVRVDTVKGPAIIGSDCAHLFQGYQEDTGSVFIMDATAWMRSFDKVKAKADIDLIFPGHDIGMSDNYIVIAEGITWLA